MNDAEMDKLLEQGLSGGPPRPGFREEVLADSAAAFVQARRSRTRWRVGSLSAAAVLIAGIAFLLGRYSMAGPMVVTPSVAAAEGVTVPNELVEWLDAAQLFRQLGMEDRMARAIDHASKLLPYDTASAGGTTGPVATTGGEGVENQRNCVGPGRSPGLPESVESRKRILAQVLGD